MQILSRPQMRPVSPRFSCGPCTKRPGWSPKNLNLESLGRSHRSKIGKARLKLAIDLTRQVLCVPDDYRIGIVPGSDTGAMEMAMWSLLGPRPVDAVAWESFSKDWVSDVLEQLKLKDARSFVAPYGELPDLTQVDTKKRDVVFIWNGTTSGVRLPNADWIADDREGLTICDATSAAFAQNIDFSKLDVTTFSWQKALGGEAAHGMIILSPRAVQRLETHTPEWPVPKLFRMTKNGKLNENIFSGETINTPSLLATEDYIDTLAWAQSIGGLPSLMARADENSKILLDWVAKTPWVDNLAKDKSYTSNTSICMRLVDPEIVARGEEAVATVAKNIVSLLEKEQVAFDIGSYRGVPPGLRIWCGTTVDANDVHALLPWLDWAFATEKAKFLKS